MPFTINPPSTQAAWACLIASGAADVAWAVCTKYSQGYTRWSWTAASVAALIAFLALLAQALKTLPLGTAYAVWTGLGAVGAVVAGWSFFGEALSLPRLAATACIVGGVAALKLTQG